MASEPTPPEESPTREIASLSSTSGSTVAAGSSSSGSSSTSGSSSPPPVLPPSPPLSAGSAPGTGSESRRRAARLPLATPEDVLLVDEVHRARFYAIFLAVVGPFALAGSFLAGPPRLARDLYVLTMGVMAITAAWVVYQLRDPASYGLRLLALIAVPSAVAEIAALYFWGPISGALVGLPLGVFFYSSSSYARLGLWLTLACVAAQVALVVLHAQGIVPDAGLIPSSSLSLQEQMLAVLTTTAVVAACFIMGRITRGVTLSSVVELKHAVREAAQRETLLAEARQDLDRALQLGGLGRYSEQIIGSYRLGVVLGRGAMGEVYEAVHVTSHEQAAVKLLHPQLLGDVTHVRRFLRETALVSGLKVPNIVQVREVGGDQGGLPYLAMERLHGETLAQVLIGTPRLSLADTVVMVQQIAAGLGAAHAAGIVHRDLKPHNLFRAGVAGSLVWKILDFGASKLGDHGDTLTRGFIIGTPGYMSPEQAQGLETDHRSDLFSLGVVAYRALTGRVAFPGDAAASLFAVVHKSPPAPSSFCDVPADVDLVLGLAMAKSRDQRLATAAELAESLEQAARGELPEPLRLRAQALGVPTRRLATA